MKICDKIVVYDLEDTFEGFYVEVHYFKELTCAYLYHELKPHAKGCMFCVNPTQNEDEIREMIESTIEECIEDYLKSGLLDDLV